VDATILAAAPLLAGALRGWLTSSGRPTAALAFDQTSFAGKKALPQGKPESNSISPTTVVAEDSVKVRR
jgi:hypothetical protein